jgi:hypothetical protein
MRYAVARTKTTLILYDETDETAPLTKRHHRKTTIYYDEVKHVETVADFMHPKHVQRAAGLVITVISKDITPSFVA